MFQRLFTMILCVFNVQNSERCRLNTRIHFGEPLPVTLRDDRILEPTDENGNIDLQHGDTLTLSCEDAGYLVHPEMRSQIPTLTVTCLGGENFGNDEFLNAPSQFSYFRCPYPKNHCSQRTNRTCFEGNPIIEVGYRIQNQFYPIYESCFDEANLHPVYSKYTQKPYNAYYQTRVDRPFFLDDGNYRDIPVTSLFSPWNQKAAVAKLVGPMIETYITKIELLSRGHLAAKTDFVFAFTERASFHYVNCAPQWYGFNGGNWNTLEVDLRDHVHAAGYDTVIYTGIYGVTQLTNHFGNRVDIYLATDENNNPVIPVPQYFYKVVYEPSTKRGIAFVGINNPYYTPAEARAMFFCKDICRGNTAFSWLSWDPDDPSEGYTFCCSIPDFRFTVNHLPQLEVRDILI
uniref:DNA/RNA non-specific endonuclease n=1 Tax=Chilo suppressalis TaxID=168631 RepID=A0A219LWI3_CHISP|nr:DNA/RNA non-specific endonuclease [Chilo suppressalis]